MILCNKLIWLKLFLDQIESYKSRTSGSSKLNFEHFAFCSIIGVISSKIQIEFLKRHFMWVNNFLDKLSDKLALYVLHFPQSIIEAVSFDNFDSNTTFTSRFALVGNIWYYLFMDTFCNIYSTFILQWFLFHSMYSVNWIKFIYVI